MMEEIKGSVLITRPESDAYDVADKIEKIGFHPICEPFLKINYHTVKIDPKPYSGVIITSSNACQALQKAGFDLSKIFVFTVGDKTAQKAKEAGCKKVISASGSVDDLVSIIKKRDPTERYIYMRGHHVTKDLSALLPQFQIDDVVVYDSEKITHISPLVEQIIMHGELSAVLFYSARTAQAFCEWVIAHSYADNVAAGLKRTRALCLGAPMVEYISDIPWKSVRVAGASNTDSLLDLLMDQEG